MRRPWRRRPAPTRRSRPTSTARPCAASSPSRVGWSTSSSAEEGAFLPVPRCLGAIPWRGPPRNGGGGGRSSAFGRYVEQAQRIDVHDPERALDADGVHELWSDR